MAINGATFNISGMGIVMDEPQMRTVGNGQRATVMIGEYPEEPNGERFKRDYLRVDLVVKQGQNPPRKGQVVDMRSGVYCINLREQDGETKRYTNITVFAWRILPINAGMPAAQAQVAAAVPTIGSATLPVSDEARPTTAPDPVIPGDEDVPF